MAAGALLSAGLVFLPAAPATGAVPDIIIPAPQGETEGAFIGKSGSTVLARIGSSQHLTTNAGATWSDAPTQDAVRAVTGGYAYTETSSLVKAFPLSGGAPLELPLSDGGMGVAWGTKVAIRDYSRPQVIVDMASQEELQSRWSGTVAGMGTSGAVWVTRTAEAEDTVEIEKWDHTVLEVGKFNPDSFYQLQVGGDQLRFLNFTASAVQYCTVPLATRTGARTCIDLQAATDTTSRWNFDLGGSDTSALIRDDARSVWLFEGGKKTRVAIPSDTGSRFVQRVDGGRPVVVITGRPFSVNEDGSLSRAATYPTGTLDQEIIGLTPGRIVTGDRHDDPVAGNLGVWSRSIGPTVVGAPSQLAARATASNALRSSLPVGFVSGLRSLLRKTPGMAMMTLVEGQRVSVPNVTGATLVSGPFVLADSDSGSVVVDAKGNKIDEGARALFGSRVAKLVGKTVTVTDLVRPDFSKSFTIEGDADASWLVDMYGDWVLVVNDVDDPASPDPWKRLYTTTAYNISTDAKVSRPQTPNQYEAFATGLGDGYAFVEGGLWRLANNTVEPLAVPQFDILSTDRVNRIAFVQDKQVVIRTIEGVGTSPARVLGVVAPATFDISNAGAAWTPEIDSTKGIAAGEIVISNASNMVVARIATPASEVGAVRNVSWDGRYSTGQWAPNGTYTWEFVADSADGTGPVKAVDGTSTVGGTLTVTGWAGFTDVTPQIEHYEHMVWLASRGITTGWADGSFRPVQPVNRDAMAAFMYRLAGSPAFTPTGQSFRDVTPETQFYKEIEWLAKKGISSGWDVPGGKEFRPLQPVARDAMSAFLYRLYGKPAFLEPAASPFTDVPVGTQFYKEMSWLADRGISKGWDVLGGKEFRPLSSVNRDAMSAFMHRGYGALGQPTP